MKVYTKTGDKGETSLIGGKRVPKNHCRIEAYGTIDELNSIIGMILNFDITNDDRKILNFIQNRLFEIGSCLAIETQDEKSSKISIESISDEDIPVLENAIDKYSEGLSVPKSFIIPAGSFIISWCNIARTVCRRAERCVISIDGLDEKYKNCIIFLNRLSDFLFIMGRKCAKENNVEEILWNNNR